MKLFVHIKTLYQVRPSSIHTVPGLEMNELPSIDNAWIAVKSGRIEAVGSMDDLDSAAYASYERIDLSGRSVLPTWVDSHTHLVFADWREREFEDRIQGLTYQEIAARGGGILNSVRRLREASEERLFEDALKRLHQIMAQGTGAIEIKSGYGLSVESELKMLRVIRRIREVAPIPVKATFLGAHAFPEEFKNDQEGYVKHLVNDMIPRVADEGLADYIDAFCEEGYFSIDQTHRILEAGQKAGLKAKVHVNQFTATGAVEMCVAQGALSVDHLEELTEADVDALKNGTTYPVALPSCSFFLGIPYTPVRRLMDANLPVVLATDFNPGSTPSGNMNFIFSLACIRMKMTPAEAVNAMTINAAGAMELSQDVGSISVGKRANFIVTREVPSLAYLPYAFGDNHIAQVYINGKVRA